MLPVGARCMPGRELLEANRESVPSHDTLSGPQPARAGPSPAGHGEPELVTSKVALAAERYRSVSR